MRFFNDPELVAKFGSWVRVQVSFYDFICTRGMELCTTHLKEKPASEYHDGMEAYERMVKAVEGRFASFEEAFAEFRREVLGSEYPKR